MLYIDFYIFENFSYLPCDCRIFGFQVPQKIYRRARLSYRVTPVEFCEEKGPRVVIGEFVLSGLLALVREYLFVEVVESEEIVDP